MQERGQQQEVQGLRKTGDDPEGNGELASDRRKDIWVGGKHYYFQHRFLDVMVVC